MVKLYFQKGYMVESLLVLILYVLYFVIWKSKQIKQKRITGINPYVLNKSTSNIQQYLNNYSKFLTVYVSIIIVLHIVDFHMGILFVRYITLSTFIFDIVGFGIGLLGLCLCLYSQHTMDSSWRVGIDEHTKTDLVTNGLYSLIRNPTYVGLFLLNIGVWLIWPTWTIFLYNLLTFIFFEIQVRCEEDYLFTIHQDNYRIYFKQTKRYIPYIY